MSTVDWTKIATHDDKNVKGFFGDYRFLSNFWAVELYFEGQLYPSAENAFQAAKIKSPYHRSFFGDPLMTPAVAKARGKELPLRPDWEEVKYDKMAQVVFAKYATSLELRQKLLATGDRYLEETNWWGDKTWGVCRGEGKNWLGELSMKNRRFWLRD